MSKRNWLLSLMGLLGNNAGHNGPDDEEESDEGEESENEEGDEGDESSEEEETEENEEEDTEGGDGEEGEAGKRSKFIPRERFDQVNAKAKQVDRLIELGIIQEGEDGELHLSKDVLKKGKADKEESEEGDEESFYFTKDDVDDQSWPLVQKINKGFKHYEALAGKMAYVLGQLRAENAVLRDFPEFLQKDGVLRKRALEIMKNDPEFKKVYAGKPDAGYWAVKRASELIAGKASVPPKKKSKSKFIIGKGDKGGKRPTKDLFSMSKAELDALELAEHNALYGNKGKKK
jgi:hypothetical protein